MVSARDAPVVVVVGPCVSGKTTLVSRLKEEGIQARCVAQEHTIIPELYRHGPSDMVVYLDVSYEEAARRRPIDWGPERLKKQKSFMESCRRAADMYVHTDGLGVEEVVKQVVGVVRQRGPVNRDGR